MNHEFAPKIERFRRFYLVKQVPEPEKLISHMPVVVLPGFGSPLESYETLTTQLNSHGFITMGLTYKYGTIGEPKKWLFVPDVDKLKQEAILEAIKNQRELTFDVVAHSKAAMDVAWLAERYPEYIRNLILVTPGGLRHEPNTIDIIGRIKGMTSLMEGERKDGEDKKRFIREHESETDIIKTIRKNNTYDAPFKRDKIRRFSEGLTSGTKYIRELLPKLRRYGIKIAIICEKDDSMYPPDSYDNFVRNNVDKYIEIPGIHGQIKFDPEVGKSVANLLKEMREDLSSKSSLSYSQHLSI